MGKDLVHVGPVFGSEAYEQPYELHVEAIYDEYVDVLPAGDAVEQTIGHGPAEPLALLLQLPPALVVLLGELHRVGRSESRGLSLRPFDDGGLADHVRPRMRRIMPPVVALVAHVWPVAPAVRLDRVADARVQRATTRAAQQAAEPMRSAERHAGLCPASRDGSGALSTDDAVDHVARPLTAARSRDAALIEKSGGAVERSRLGEGVQNRL